MKKFVCSICGYVHEGEAAPEKCPQCGSTKIRQWTRTIGYLRPVDCFDKYRKAEAKTRIYHGRSNLRTE